MLQPILAGMTRSLGQRVQQFLRPRSETSPSINAPALRSVSHRENRDNTVENLIKPHAPAFNVYARSGAAAADSVVFTNSEQCRGHRLNQRRHTARHDLRL
jgi:hypothetical protein